MTLIPQPSPDLEKRLALIVGSNLEDRHKVDAIMDIIRVEREQARREYLEQLKTKCWGFSGAKLPVGKEYEGYKEDL